MVTDVERFAALTLSSGDLETTFVPEVGMLGVSLRHRGEELLGQAGGVRGYLDAGPKMGIPFLHPWANRLGSNAYAVAGRRVRLPAASPLVRREEHGLPIHGLLGAIPSWDVRSVDADGGEVALVAELDFLADERLAGAFPFPHRIVTRVALSDAALRIETAVTATGPTPVPIAFGYHPYLRLPGVDREDWRVALPARRHLLADDLGIPTGASERRQPEDGPLDDRVYDDGYDELAPPSFSLTGGGRAIIVDFLEGYPVAQVFAPPDQDVICFEPMTAPTDALVSGEGLRLLAPGGTFTAAFAIRVVPV